MKRSEREKELLAVLDEFWRRPWGDIEEIRPALAECLIEAEEARGATFDPEEEPLPERLAVNAGAIYDPETGQAIALLTGKQSPERVEIQRTAIEAVRRFNSWLRLRKRAEAYSGSALALDILTILDDKEET